MASAEMLPPVVVAARTDEPVVERGALDLGDFGFCFAGALFLGGSGGRTDVSGEVSLDLGPENSLGASGAPGPPADSMVGSSNSTVPAGAADPVGAACAGA